MITKNFYSSELKRIAIRIEVDQEMIMIHFKDTGTGIGREHWESVFNPFLSLKPEGMGLGLPYVKKIIIEHLGNIRIVESSAEGTHFQIEIPQNGILNMD
ncbi:ATP-binding protein [Heyndrickxia coagulans]|uniref:ATP-binding protein n=1 Tax=Heyndrickxia coagulans TaxID=1398 RepID=UPI002E15CE5D